MQTQLVPGDPILTRGQTRHNLKTWFPDIRVLSVDERLDGRLQGVYIAVRATNGVSGACQQPLQGILSRVMVELATLDAKDVCTRTAPLGEDYLFCFHLKQPDCKVQGSSRYHGSIEGPLYFGLIHSPYLNRPVSCSF